LVSAIILNFNGIDNLKEILTRCVASVLNSDYPNLEVIFFDNGSTDRSIEVVKQEFKRNPKLKIIGIPKNCGPTVGYNNAMKHAQGKYVVFLNNDVEIESDSISELVKVMENDSRIGIAQSKIVFFDRHRIQSVGNVLDFTLSTLLIGNNEEDKGQYDVACEPTFPCGVSMMARKSVINKIDLFDPNYFFYHDDCDLGWRTRLAGFKVVYVPSSKVYHKGEGTSSHSFQSGAKFYYLLTSRFGLYIKNLEFKSMLKLGVPMSANAWRDISAMLIQGDAITPIRIMIWTLRKFKGNWQRRQIVQTQIRKISDKELFEHFIDSSVFLLLIKRNLRKLSRAGERQEEFDKSVNKITNIYYRNHKYSPRIA
jgi:GT2 family glycosyltransferase